MLSTFYIIAFVARERPFVSPHANSMELFNEITVYIAVYPLLFFTNWVDSEETKDIAGWCLVGCIFITILFNIGVTIYQGCKQLWKNIRRKWHRYHWKKARE